MRRENNALRLVMTSITDASYQYDVEQRLQLIERCYIKLKSTKERNAALLLTLARCLLAYKKKHTPSSVFLLPPI